MDWYPFVVCKDGEKAPKPRAFRTREGLGDRLRTAAFAEFQAIRAFAWASERFDEVPDELRQRWAEIVFDEQKHYDLIIHRMNELNINISKQPVSAALWNSLKTCEKGRDFCIYIASAEERGRQAGLVLIKTLEKSDPITAGIFRKICHDEIEHVALASKFFGWKPNTLPQLNQEP